MSATIRFGLFISAAFFIASSGWAQDYPDRSVRVVAPYSPGGSTDVLARLISAKLSQFWGKNALVDNRPGASGNIGADHVAKSRPDGYTLLVAGAPHAISASLFRKLPYSLERDLIAINRFATFPSAIAVHPLLPVKNVRQLIALAKARPGDLNYGSAGVASPNNLGMALFKTMAKVNMVHIPYKGGTGQMVVELISGQVQLASIGLVPAMPYIKSGKLRALAVTSTTRSPLLPKVPTVSESGLPGYAVVSWYGMFAPAETPAAIISKVHDDITRLLSLPDIKKRLAGFGAEPAPMSQTEFGRFVHDEIARWAEVVKASGAKVD